MPAANPAPTTVLVCRAPGNRVMRTLLYAFRRMAAHGLDDAHAANAMLGQFGTHSRQLTVLVRTLIWEISRTSQQSITVAPCCCRRMTEAEDLLLAALAGRLSSPAMAADALTSLLGHDAIGGPAMAMGMLARALADRGYALAMTG